MDADAAPVAWRGALDRPARRQDPGGLDVPMTRGRMDDLSVR